jgi:hypothetical protein
MAAGLFMARWAVQHTAGRRGDREGSWLALRLARFSEARADRVGQSAPGVHATRPAYFPNRPLMT